jgi:hypothetical protein
VTPEPLSDPSASPSEDTDRVRLARLIGEAGSQNLRRTHEFLTREGERFLRTAAEVRRERVAASKPAPFVYPLR